MSREGREVFLGKRRLIAQRRRQFCFFKLLLLRPRPFVFRKSLNILSNHDRAAGLYLYGSISPAVVGHSGEGGDDGR